MTSREDDLEYAIVCARNSLAATAALLEELAQDVALGESGEYHGASLEELLTGCANQLQALRAGLYGELTGEGE